MPFNTKGMSTTLKGKVLDQVMQYFQHFHILKMINYLYHRANTKL